MDSEKSSSILEKGAPLICPAHLLRDVPLPAAAIFTTSLDHNLAWMQSFAEKHGAKLAPHGKTTMAPALFRRQIEEGAWGITLATAVQTKVAHACGVKRVLMANQLIGCANMALIAEAVASGLEYYCVVDSIDNVRQLGAFFGARDLSLNVLLELGVESGRCGCRSAEQVQALVAAIGEQPALMLMGIEGYEGMIGGSGEIAAVRAYGELLVDTVRHLHTSGVLESEAPIVTASGSKWFDLIAQAFDRAELRECYTPVLRPGCYVVHDHGLYAGAMNAIRARQPELEGALQPALEVFAHVQSLPEPGLAIVAMGKRDIGHEPDLPIALRHYSVSGLQSESGPAPEDAYDMRTTHIMDQHTFLQIPTDASIAVGDVIAFGTSHPCLTFDKWRRMLLVDDQLCIEAVIETCF